MTTINHLSNFEELDFKTTEELSNTADELLAVEHLDSDNTKYLAGILLSLGRYGESIEQLERILTMKSNDEETIALIAISHFKNKDYRTAIEYINRGLEINPEDERLLSYKMLCCEFLDEYASAIRCGEKILKNHPKSTHIIRHLIDCHLKAKNYDKCLYYLDQIKYMDHYEKALILYEAEMYEKCIKEARQVRTAKSLHLIGKSHQKLGNTLKAARYLYRSYEKDPNVDILFEIAEIYFDVMDYKRSITFLEMVLSHDEKNIKAHCRIAKAYFESSNWHGAIEYAERALEISRKVPEAYITLADAYFFSGTNSEKVMEILDEGISENPESARLWAKKGNMEFNHDLYTFRQSYEKAISLNPSNYNIYEEYIFLLMINNETEEAKKWYNQMLLFNPLFEESFQDLNPWFM